MRRIRSETGDGAECGAGLGRLCYIDCFMSLAPELQKTPLNAVHRALGARMVDFGGWDMPVQYTQIIEEHNTVRRAVGLFDVSHMGEVEIRGPQAFDLV